MEQLGAEQGTVSMRGFDAPCPACGVRVVGNANGVRPSAPIGRNEGGRPNDRADATGGPTTVPLDDPIGHVARFGCLVQRHGAHDDAVRQAWQSWPHGQGGKELLDPRRVGALAHGLILEDPE